MVKQRGLAFTVLLLAILSMALVGCGGGSQTEDQTSNTPDQTSQEDTNTDTSGDSASDTTTSDTNDTNETEDTSSTANNDNTTAENEDSTAAESTESADASSEDSTEMRLIDELEVTSLEFFPQNRNLVLGGTVSVNASLRNAGSEEVTETVWLFMNGNPVASQEVSLAAGGEGKFYFQTDPVRVEGPQIFTILDSPATVDVVAPALDPAVRPGQITADARVLTEGEGIIDVGIPGGQIVTSAFEPPKTFNPYAAQETSSTSIIHRMHSYLVEENPMDYGIVPGLAKSWELSDDATEVIFHLRRNLKFSDGHPFTSDDVVFTLNDVILNCDVPNNVRDTYFVKGKAIRYEKIDDHTVRAVLPSTYRPFFDVIKNDPILPKHLLAGRVARLVPGAWQHFSIGRCAYSDSRGALRAAFSGEDIDGMFEAIDDAFSALSDAIQGKNVEEIKGTMLGVTRALEDLKGSVNSTAGLETVLDDAIAELALIEEQAQSGVWGVRPGSFSDTWTTAANPSEIAGLGPYSLNRYDVEQQVVLDRNPNYWKVDTNGVQLPYLERLIVLVVKDRNTQVAKFRTGETDVLQLDGSNRPQDWPDILQDAESKGWEAITGGPLFTTLWVMFNQDVEVRGNPGDLNARALQTVFRELDFRKAIAHSVNKQKLINNIYNGLGQPQWSPVAVPSPFYDDSHGDDYDPYAYNPDLSNSLLEALGLIDVDGDGVRNITDQFLLERGFSEDELAMLTPEADREISFTLSTNQGNEVREQSSEAMVSDAKDIGIQINYKPKDFNALVTDLLGSQYNAILLGFTGEVDPNSSVNIWRTTGHLHSWSYSSADNPRDYERRIDELFDLAASTLDFDEAKEYYVDLSRQPANALRLKEDVGQQPQL